ncbi:hypothetical protein CLV41_102221 [Roseibium marinum]|uniref:Uncharacterized protein n=1 Tax=Roseibium marinum TaxID=281252 RepID=A0A2S3UYP8_9HYPH|nr:hypothetical protein CLV41_102221 [Roseibium marinum]
MKGRVVFDCSVTSSGRVHPLSANILHMTKSAAKSAA